MRFLPEIWSAVEGGESLLDNVSTSGSGDLSSCFFVTDLATASIGAAALALSELIGGSKVIVDRRLASFWFRWTIRPEGWKVPPAWDPIAGDYRTKGGWIRLHTNAPHHRRAAERILGEHADKAAMAKAVAQWQATELEAAIVGSGGCAAEMRSIEEWANHPQGMAVSTEPLDHLESRPASFPVSWRPTQDRPLKGLKVLDLTRVLAGPVATRFLAGFGADVLRIDPPGWEEPSLEAEVNLGKRCARLNLHEPADRATFERLLSQADVLMHGYRPGALDGLGYDSSTRRRIAPNLIDISLCAFGWTGPWSGRRGFDSLVQMSCGIAEAGMHWKGADVPVPLPAQALDHATGYLMAAAAVKGLSRLLISSEATTVRLSLARTAKLLVDEGRSFWEEELAPETEGDYCPATEETEWGPMRRLLPPVTVVGAEMQWKRPACSLGSIGHGYHFS